MKTNAKRFIWMFWKNSEECLLTNSKQIALPRSCKVLSEWLVRKTLLQKCLRFFENKRAFFASWAVKVLGLKAVWI